MCKIIAVTNRTLCRGDFSERIRLLCRCGVDKIVLREKDLSPDEYMSLAKDVLKICGEYSVECTLHKFVDAAIKLSAPSIHLSLEDAAAHRDELKNFETFGISTHSPEQLCAAQDEFGADYVFYGHVFPTDCKPGVPERGLGALKEICSAASIPVYAIGGISPENAKAAISAGARGVCLMSWCMTRSEKEIKSFIDKSRA